MATSNYKPYNSEDYPIKAIHELHIAIIATEWNEAIVNTLLSNCRKELRDLGIDEEKILVYKVPGSYELPQGAKLVISSKIKPDAVICLGCVIQGETKHDDYINHTIARSLNQIGLITGIPAIFGVLTTNTVEQAIARADGSSGDKGKESAQAALKMISLKEQVEGQGRKISF